MKSTLFKARRSPELGLGVYAGQVYTGEQLIVRCRGDIIKLQHLVSMLSEAGGVDSCFDEEESMSVVKKSTLRPLPEPARYILGEDSEGVSCMWKKLKRLGMSSCR